MIVKPKVVKGHTIYKQTWQDKRIHQFQWNKVEGKSVLDLGCAQGILCLQAKKSGADKVVGVDIEPKKIQTAKDRAKLLQMDIDFFADNIESENFKKRMPRFDWIFYCAMSSHMKDDKAMLRWIDRHTNIGIVYGTNLRHSPQKAVDKLTELTSFSKIKGPYDISDIPDTYYLIAAHRNGHDIQEVFGKYKDVPITTIHLKEMVMRTFEDLRPGQKEVVKKLAKNIKRNGLVVPILVMQHPRKKGYTSLEGGHRLFAADYLGLEKIPVKIIKK